MKKVKLAITGSIGSGKSTFCKFLSALNIPVISADEISKEILAADKSIQKQIIKEFGEESFIDGKPNKEFLAKTVFSDPIKVVVINNILHPKVIKEIVAQLENKQKTHPVVACEAALIYEAEMEEIFDYVVLVTAELDKRRDRKKELSEDDFINRNNNQIPDSEKEKLSDFVFVNNGSIEDLKQKAELLIKLVS